MSGSDTALLWVFIVTLLLFTFGGAFYWKGYGDGARSERAGRAWPHTDPPDVEDDETAWIAS